MAKNNNLKDFVTDIADAIRAKKGTSDLINPQDFATEIEGISGGSGESGDSSWRYFDTTSMGSSSVYALDVALLAKGENSDTNGVSITTAYGLIANNAQNIKVYAIAWDESATMIGAGGVLPGTAIVDMIKSQLGVPEITKEQFYSLD
jgi:hypothetical protein